MSDSQGKHLTEYARYFLEPQNATHRQYEALRAYFVQGLTSAEAAARFGYSPGSFRVLCHQYRQDPDRPFFLPPAKGPSTAPKQDQLRERIIALRKQNLSIYEISQLLTEAGQPCSPATVDALLKAEGFARLPRRRDEERPPGARPEAAAVADVRQLDLSPRRFSTQFGGLFLFIPYLVQLDFDQLITQVGLPGSQLVPAPHALRSLLALKLWGRARHSHVMSSVLDEGLALFAGLNVIPKRAFLTEYSCRIHPETHPRLMQRWFEAMQRLGQPRGTSFDLDFHTIPFHGEDALVEKHYVSKRSRRQKGVLAFLAQDAATRVFCYANSDLRQAERNDEVLSFVHFWQQRTGELPEELIFDSQLTTYANLHRLNRLGVRFITLRRRSRRLLEAIHQTPLSAWRRLELPNLKRAFRTPRILDTQVQLDGYTGPLRQLTITDLGHEEPTLLLTNDLQGSAIQLITRYAQRMLIENQIADGIEFFHMDALSSAVAMKVNCDLQLTLMASSLYRCLGTEVGRGYQTAKSQHTFRDLVEAAAWVTVTDSELQVRFHRRAHNPLLVAAGFADRLIPIPWLQHRRLRLVFG
jgi:transposase